MRTILIFLSACLAAGHIVHEGNTCTLYPEPQSTCGIVDDSPSILEAFDLCGTDGTVIFSDGTFHVNSVLNTTNLANCDVQLRGELRFSTDTAYWRSHAYPLAYQNQVTAWLFGGTNVTFRGLGGWYNGQGQKWYTEAHDQSNQPGRPISLTVYNSTNVLVDGLRVIQPQFWATFVVHSRNVSFTNLFVNATSDNEWHTFNTDGYDSWNSDGLLVENAIIINGDDCVAAKGNTTNLYVKNVTCIGSYNGLFRSNGMTIGSVGQYPSTPDYVENVTFEDVRCIDCMDGAYIKTWQGTPNSNNVNGDTGGGGSGYVKNVTFKNIHMENVSLPIQISQCVYTDITGSGTCNTSKIQIENILWQNITGTSQYNIAASLYCTEAHPCPGVRFEDVNISPSLSADVEIEKEVYQCANIANQADSGIPCNKRASDDFSQYVFSNVS